jgi:hypothetical protein
LYQLECILESKNFHFKKDVNSSKELASKVGSHQEIITESISAISQNSTTLFSSGVTPLLVVFG